MKSRSCSSPDTAAAESSEPSNRRQHWLSVLAKSAPDELECELEEAQTVPEYTWIRAPEVGSVMVRARAGGSGVRFNLGEMTVTRCALRLAGGTVGYGHVGGRAPRHAELVALFDALAQTNDDGASFPHTAIERLAQAQADRKEQRSRKANATKVDFFTLVRGDNPT